MQTFLLFLILATLNDREIRRLIVKLELKLKGFNTAYDTCKGCGMNCHSEYYMVSHAIWRQANPFNRLGMLCIGCLEIRIGRELKPNDFLTRQAMSERLKSRMGPPPPRTK